MDGGCGFLKGERFWKTDKQALTAGRTSALFVGNVQREVNNAIKRIVIGLGLILVILFVVQWMYDGYPIEIRSLSSLTPEELEEREIGREDTYFALDGDTVSVYDYWNPLSYYVTVHASARRLGPVLFVTTRRTFAADEMGMTGSAVQLEIPVGEDADKIKWVIVCSKDGDETHWSRWTLPKRK